MSNQLDILIFGASSFTGKYALRHAYNILKDVAWGVSGRSEDKLKRALQEAALRTGNNDFERIPIIVADVEDEATIKKMVSKTKILVNFTGPFDFNGGELVVKCCIEAGTHYLDVSAEQIFINNIILKYGKYAEDKGVYILNMCGFDSVPYDLGVSFMERQFGGVLNSMEIYLNSRRDPDCAPGPSIHYTTWKSAINTLAKYKKLKNSRKHLHSTTFPRLKPKLTTKLPHRLKEGLAIPFAGTDEEAIHRSQLYFYENNNKRPIQVRNYVIMDSYYTVIVTSILLLFCFLLAQFAFGRSILLKYPEFFSYGTFSHEDPTEDMLNKRNFSLIFKGRGWMPVQANDKKQYQNRPNREIIGCVSGRNPAYGFTALSAVLCALTMLQDVKALPSRGGIYSPAAAFSKTSLIERLQSNGINFEVISMKELK